MKHNKKNLLIIGAGGLGRMTLDLVEKDYNCFFVDDGYDCGEMICDTKVVGRISDLDNLRRYFDNCIVTIGDNKIREQIVQKCLLFGFNIISIISPNAFASKWAKIGEGCVVMPYATIQNGSTIGKGTILCSHVEIHHDSSVGDFCVIYPNTTIRTYVNVGNRVKCGSNVSVGNNCKVDDDSIIKDGLTIEEQYATIK